MVAYALGRLGRKLGLVIKHRARRAFGLCGVYQFSSLKKACLRWCAEPVTFFLLHWKNGRTGAIVMGLKNGGFCLGCCWVLMLLLFVGGVMELRWIFLLAFFRRGGENSAFGGIRDNG